MAEYNKILSHHIIANGKSPMKKCYLAVWEWEGTPHFEIIQKEENENIGRVTGGTFLGNAEASV
eukprot:12417802-Ditylum_brightwellii.AAC.1